MRILRSRSFRAAPWAGCLPLLAAGGCLWSDFDDLQKEAWATATTKPKGNAASSWGVAIARVAQNGGGGTLAVLGASSASYEELSISPDGTPAAANQLDLNMVFPIGNLAIEPLFLSRPEADEVALVTAQDAAHVMVIRAVGGQLTPTPVMGPAQPNGATYLLAPPPVSQTRLLVAEHEVVFPVSLDPAKPVAPETKCPLIAPGEPSLTIRALGAYRPTGALGDDVLVLTENGKLIAYPGDALSGGCSAGIMQPPRPGLIKDIGLPNVETGSQIFAFTDAQMSYVLVQAHNADGQGRLGLYRIGAASIDEVGTTRDLDRLRTAALFQPMGETRRFVVAGLPTAVVGGVPGAGQVQVLEVSTASGIAMTPAATLSDIQPEVNQAFGRGVAALPFNNKSIIAVAADNEVFLYFRTALYGETREGR